MYIWAGSVFPTSKLIRGGWGVLVVKKAGGGVMSAFKQFMGVFCPPCQK